MGEIVEVNERYGGGVSDYLDSGEYSEGMMWPEGRAFCVLGRGDLRESCWNGGW